MEGQMANAAIGNTGTLKKPAQRFTDGERKSQGLQQVSQHVLKPVHRTFVHTVQETK